MFRDVRRKELKKWPKIDDKFIKQEKIKMAIQINGKTRCY